MPAAATTGTTKLVWTLWAIFATLRDLFTAESPNLLGPVAAAEEPSVPQFQRLPDVHRSWRNRSMSLRRFMLSVVSMGVIAGTAVAQGGDWTPRPFASQIEKQQDQRETLVQKDDSQLWAVERQKSEPPFVDVAGKTKRKTASSSAWNRLWRPSQWFKGSKKK
jgi:hypothetical protein